MEEEGRSISQLGSSIPPIEPLGGGGVAKAADPRRRRLLVGRQPPGRRLHAPEVRQIRGPQGGGAPSASLGKGGQLYVCDRKNFEQVGLCNTRGAGWPGGWLSGG